MAEIEFPPGYIYSLTPRRIEMHFPNLKIGENAFHKSRKGDNYNCAGWALESKDDWVQFKDEKGNPDYRLETYVTFYEQHGFSRTTSLDFEKGVVRILIYADERGDFAHVARQLSQDLWTSKVGDWEDIEHTTPEAIGGKTYGNAAIIMRKEMV